jgi:hypothetical protein
MKASARTWLILAVMALVVALLYYLLEVREIATETGGDEEYVWDLEAAQVVGVRVMDNISGTVTALESDAEGAWRVAEPVQELAKVADVVALNQALARLQVRRSIEEPPQGEMEAYGLVTPTYTIEVQVDDGQVLRLDVGVESPVSAYYARRGGDEVVLLVPDYALDRIVAILANPPVLGSPTATPGMPAVGPSQEEP